MFKTNNLTLAATLCVKGYRLAQVEIEPGTTTRGVFEFDEIPEHLIEEYDYGKSLVEPASFQMEIRRLTTLTRRVGELG